MSAEMNIPEIVAEVRAAHERYDAAIDSRDVATLNELFWNAEGVVRFGFGENLFGHDELVRFRGTKWQDAPERRVAKLVITTIGRDSAATSVVFERGDRISRQSQTWARLPEGWRIVAAHVSEMNKPAG